MGESGKVDLLEKAEDLLEFSTHEENPSAINAGLKLCLVLASKCCPKALKSAQKSPILKLSESSFSGLKQPKPAKNCLENLVLVIYEVKSWKLLQI